MSLLEETYRKIDPDGVVNMGYIDTEPTDDLSKMKNGRNLLEA